MGPDLTDAWKRLNPDWMVQWIKNPQAFDPASLMPNLGVSTPRLSPWSPIWKMCRGR